MHNVNKAHERYVGRIVNQINTYIFFVLLNPWLFPAIEFLQTLHGFPRQADYQHKAEKKVGLSQLIQSAEYN